jgi:Casein kinase II regulatory subunit
MIGLIGTTLYTDCVFAWNTLLFFFCFVLCYVPVMVIITTLFRDVFIWNRYLDLLLYVSSLHCISPPFHHLPIPHQPIPHPLPMRCDADIDGAFFGPTFPNLFFMTYEEVVPEPVAEQVMQHSTPTPPYPCGSHSSVFTLCVFLLPTLSSHMQSHNLTSPCRERKSIFESLHFALSTVFLPDVIVNS